MQWGSRLTRLTSFIMKNAESVLFTMSCFHWIWPELTWLSSTFWLIDNVACVSETQILLHDLFEKKTERHIDWQFREKNKHATEMVKNCLRILLMEETEGMEAGSHTLWESSCSLISQANIPATSFIAWSLVTGQVVSLSSPGLSVFSRMILFTTDGVATCCAKIHLIQVET